MASEMMIGESESGSGTTTRVSVEEFRRMIDSGKIAEDAAIELLEGEIVKKMTKHPPHILAMKKLIRVLNRIVPDDWHAQFQDSILLTDSMPEPDVVVIRGQPEDYGDRLAEPSEIGLIIEVAESSLVTDRRKAVTYARHGLPQYWIVNLVSPAIEVYSDPVTNDEGSCYKSLHTFRRSESLPLVLDDKAVAEIPVDDILP